MASLPGWFETADVSNYTQNTTLSTENTAIFVPVDLNEAPNNPACIEIRLRAGSVGGTYKLALYADSSGAPGSRVAHSNSSITGVSADSFFSLVITKNNLAPGLYWIGVRGNNGGAPQPNIRADITSPAPTGHTEPVARFGTINWGNSWPSTAPSTSNISSTWPYGALYLDSLVISDTAGRSESVSVTVATLSIADTGAGSDALGTLSIAPLSIADTGTGTEGLSRNVPDAGAGADSVAIEASLSLAETGRGEDGLFREDQVTILDNTATVFEVLAAPLQTVEDAGGSPDLDQIVTAPLFPITDTGTGADVVSRPLEDTGAGADEVTVAVDTLAITDTGQGFETILISGQEVTPPAAAATGGLDAKHVLRLLYGNDKRNPSRTLDLAQTASGHIFLTSGGFSPGAGELTELWSGESIRFDGQKKLAESRKNSVLNVTYDLKSGSMAGLSQLQREINRFFMEAKLNQLNQQGERVWLEYRWSDNLSTLPTPKFGQLSGYYEIYSVKSPRWPADLHSGNLVAGNILDAVIELTCSPAPEGLKQKCAQAKGNVSLHAKGVLIATGDAKLHWPGYANSGLTGNFAVTGWFTRAADWGGGAVRIFEYYVNASNRISIIYNIDQTRFTIEKVVSGSLQSTNSSNFAVADGDDVHLVLVQDDTTLRLYVNGVEIASVTATNTMTDSGLIALGCRATGAIEGIGAILDGWRILPAAITATQAGALYTAELPIKQNGGRVGEPLLFWTKDGDNQLDNADESGRDNWGWIGGVGGDIEAKVEIRIAPLTNYGNNTFWLGIKAQDGSYTPSSYTYIESNNGTVDSTSSGGGYESVTSNDNSFAKSKTGLSAKLLFNRYRALTRVFGTNGQSYKLTAGFNFAQSGDPVFWGREYNYAGISKWQIVDLGDLFVMADSDILQSNNVTLTVLTRFTANASQNLRWDYTQLIPWPYVKISADGVPTIDGTIPLIVEDGQAYLYNLSSFYKVQHLTHEGPPLRAVPSKYNYLFLVQSQSSVNAGVSNVATLDIYVTPRYLLPGGMVA